MDPHLALTAQGFRVAGWVMGIPSLSGLVFFGSYVLRDKLQTAAVQAQSSKSGSSLVDLLLMVAEGFGSLFRFIDRIALWLATALTGTCLVTLLLSILFYFTGRGLASEQTWARVAATLCAGIVVLFGAGLALSTRRGTMTLIGLSMVGMAGYAAWASWRRLA